MEHIFHEIQEGALCAQHCINSLLQGPYFNAVDLATIARDLDEQERQRMAEGDTNSLEYMNFLQEPSSNMDDSGYFSIQVICKALEVWNLEMVPYNSQGAQRCREKPCDETGYICNQQNHWLTIRKLGRQWFNLNSVKAQPELISDTYLALLLAQLQTEGYSIYVIVGNLPDCKANNILLACPLSVGDYNKYVDEQREKSKRKASATAQGSSSKVNKTTHNDKDEVVDTTPAVSADPIAVRNKRLQYFEKKTTTTTNSTTTSTTTNATSSATSTATRTQSGGPKQPVENSEVVNETNEVNEEDDETRLMRAIEMSLQQQQ